MTSVRTSVLSVLAVPFALAVGVALGGGPLQADPEPAAATGDGGLAAAEDLVAALSADLDVADAYALATTGAVVGGRLDGRAVTVVSLPGADAESVGTLTDLVERAGGSLAGRLSVTEALLDVGNRQLVTELAAQMEDAARRAVDVPARSNGYERMGRLLARAVATDRPAGESLDPAAEGLLAGATAADLVATQGTLARRGSLVLVVAGAPYGSADDRDGAGLILTSLVTALDDVSGGVVLAGPASSGAPDGLVGAVRSDPAAADVSTVDLADRAPGGAVTVLALAGQAAGRSGQFGSASASDGPVP